MATTFQVEQAEQFQRLIAARTEPLTMMQALTAIDHIEALAGEEIAAHLGELIRAETNTTPGLPMIDTHRCVTHDGRHILADGSVA
jgi:plasmid stabilization system protein ParE